MIQQLVLPESTVRLIRSTQVQHPGLQLDKYSVPGDQQAQKKALDDVCRVSGDSSLLKDLLARRQAMLKALPGGKCFACTTTGPLTLHLARTTALENAGICLHPIYGFAYLPGSGLKGLARAYAETVWLPAQSDQPAAWRQIEDVFGWAPNPDRRQQIANSHHPAAVRHQDDTDPDSPEVKAACGNVVFHDAWPERWPRLVVDIVNNHHSGYYQETHQHPPGDWEDPVPVYFLAVAPDVTFTFPLSKRHHDVSDDLLELARAWLLGGLCHLGAGAKTNTGYGAFKPAEGTLPPLPEHRLEIFETELKLTSPAFLAGANQQREDCDLRPATLRGLLRWWWRTLHAGAVDVTTLRALEAAIWGDTKGGAAVRLVVERVFNSNPQLYNKRELVNFDDQKKKSEYGIPEADPKKTTQGLWYLSYGMDESSREGERKQRHWLEPGATWRLRLVARPTHFVEPVKTGQKANRQADKAQPVKDTARPITADEALEQAKAALWLLCHFGGVGSKARKGFGSLQATQLADGYRLETCQQAAKRLREKLGLVARLNPDAIDLGQMLGPVEVDFSWPDVWSVLDQVGFAYQAFAKKYKHKLEKKALGLPRRIGPPVQGSFTPRPPVKDRHASPVHIHLAPRKDGKQGWTVRIVAFPSAYLPDLGTSRNFLQAFLQKVKSDLEQRASLSAPGGQKPAVSNPAVGSASASTTSFPSPGTTVKAVLLEEKTKKGGWKARHLDSRREGPIVNTKEVPGDKQPGEEVELIVASAGDSLSFRWPTEEEKQRAQKAQDKTKKGPGHQPKGGRR